MANKKSNKTPKTAKNTIASKRTNKRQTEYGYKTDLKKVDKSNYYDVFKQLVNSTNRKINRLAEGKTNDSREVMRINQLVDRANAVKSSGKLVDREGNFLRTNKNGVRLFAQSKKDFEKLTTNQQRALIKGLQNINTSEEYGQKTFSKKGLDSYFNRSESKMRATIQNYMKQSDVVKEYIKKCEENGKDPQAELKRHEDIIVEKIYSNARNHGNLQSEQIVDEVVLDLAKMSEMFTKQEIQKMKEDTVDENEKLKKLFAENRKKRGIKER